MVGRGIHQKVFKCAKYFIRKTRMRTILCGCERMFDKEWKTNLWEMTYRYGQTPREYWSWSNKRILLQYHLRIFRWRSNSLLQYFKVTCLSNALLHMNSELCNPSCSFYIKRTQTALLLSLRQYVQIALPKCQFIFDLKATVSDDHITWLKKIQQAWVLCQIFVRYTPSPAVWKKNSLNHRVWHQQEL